MGKIILILFLILGIIFLFFKGVANVILTLTGFKKASRNNNQNSKTKDSTSTPNEGILYEKGETKVFKGMAGSKSNKENKDNL